MYTQIKRSYFFFFNTVVSLAIVPEQVVGYCLLFSQQNSRGDSHSRPKLLVLRQHLNLDSRDFRTSIYFSNVQEKDMNDKNMTSSLLNFYQC